MDIQLVANTLFPMGKPPRRHIPPPAVPERRMHLHEWMVRLGKRSVDIAEKAQVGAPYISSLKNGPKQGKKPKKPTPDVMFAIADALGITVDALYQPPPPQAAVEAVSHVDAAVLEKLIQAQKTRKPKK